MEGAKLSCRWHKDTDTGHMAIEDPTSLAIVGYLASTYAVSATWHSKHGFHRHGAPTLYAD